MSGGLAFASFAGAGLASDLFGVVGIVKILSGTCTVFGSASGRVNENNISCFHNGTIYPPSIKVS
jgi:hypothetical protein